MQVFFLFFLSFLLLSLAALCLLVLFVLVGAAAVVAVSQALVLLSSFGRSPFCSDPGDGERPPGRLELRSVGFCLERSESPGPSGLGSARLWALPPVLKRCKNHKKTELFLTWVLGGKMVPRGTKMEPKGLPK